ISKLLKLNKSYYLIFLGKIGRSNLDGQKKLIKELGLDSFIRYTGVLGQKELAAYLHCGDLLLLHENLKNGRGGISAKSGVVMGAMASGLPIFANKGDMTDDFFEEVRNVVFINNSITDTALQLHQAFNCGTIQKIRKSICREEKRYSWEA